MGGQWRKHNHSTANTRPLLGYLQRALDFDTVQHLRRLEIGLPVRAWTVRLGSTNTCLELLSRATLDYNRTFCLAASQAQVGNAWPTG